MPQEIKRLSGLARGVRRAEKGGAVRAGIGEGRAVEQHPAEDDKKEGVQVAGEARRAFEPSEQKELFQRQKQGEVKPPYDEVPAAPCQSPVSAQTIRMLQICRAIPHREPPRGIYT